MVQLLIFTAATIATVKFFMTIEDFFYSLSPKEQVICFRLREIILSSAPDFDEKFSYGVPYYFRRRRVTCIWPNGVWGGPPRGVFIGFCQGNKLSNEQGIIEMGKRKRFGLIRFYDSREIKEEPLLEILHEAIMVDERLTIQKQ